MDTNKEVVSPEELAAEQAATQNIKEDEVRKDIIEKFGFDEKTDAEKIDKLVADKVDSHKKLSSAIGQKIKYRDAVQKNKTTDKSSTTGKKDDEDLSTTDFYILVEAKVPKEDVEEVKKASKLLGKSIADTLKDDMVQSLLGKRAAERVTANAANTGSARRTTGEVSDETLTQNLSKGEVPEKGSKEADKLFWARRGGKK